MTAPLARFQIDGCMPARIHALNSAVILSGSQVQSSHNAAGPIPSGPGDFFEAWPQVLDAIMVLVIVL
jgi:hypothetical protein